MIHNTNHHPLCCFHFQVGEQAIAVTLMHKAVLWHIELNSSAHLPPLPAGLVQDWLYAWFALEGLPNHPAMRPPRHRLDAAMRSYLWAIPTGETRTYGEMAFELGTSPRGAGRMLGANPLPVIVPCHRIVARHGAGGFHGGLQWKNILLDHEYRRRNRQNNAAPVISANQS